MEPTELTVVDFLVRTKGWSEPDAQRAVRGLWATKKWSYRHIYLGFVHDFKCHYCGRDLLASADDYKLWEQDHIMPGGGDDPDNLVLACLICNSKFKGRWRPQGADRDSRLASIAERLAEVRARTSAEVAEIRRLLGREAKP
jgi:5-methylcytosine-specific restriction endonuclease McrA